MLGIPFDFTAKPVVAPVQPPRETIQVKAVRPGRDALEIRFPRVAGYRVYRRSALEKIDYSTVEAEGYAFQIEMTYRARNAGASIKEIPITFVDRTLGSSKMSPTIVIEALWLVTLWALRRPFAASRPS